MDFSKQEENILSYWKENRVFEKSLELSKGFPKYTFYDGPPFATGLPHYGHIVASTIKDIIPRYKTQNGYYVPRVFGFDTHGLPIEFEIEKSLGIKTREEVLKMGIGKYNEECRKIVMRYSSEWKQTIDRLGRWVDFENGYKTLDKSFMESVWWVFKQLYEKNLVYHGVKVMPYSNACNTPLSNFEAKSNYKKVSDPSLTVTFQLENNKYLLVWTTTPWTLPSNLLLCLNDSLTYVEIEHNGKNIILSESALKRYKLDKEKIIQKHKGSDLIGLKYYPLFPYFQNEYSNGFHLVSDNYVSSDNGTGIVHIAPAFGEDDYRVSMKNEVISKTKLPPCPLDENGRFIFPVEEFQGMVVKDADKPIIAKLKTEGKIFKVKYELHEYPFCWRSNTPLIYRSVPCWFVNVESIKEKIIKNNGETYWVPEHIRDGRFGSWLKDCKDWCVSRNRFWGTPIPLWINEDFSEIECVGSVKELEDLAGLAEGSLHDLHRHFIDEIRIPSKSNPGTYLKRIDEVFDCWFESGSMPYAAVHYPFKHRDDFLKGMFPADFIGEGLDQTRGWFYTLMVLSTALFDKPAFKNVIVNGLVLASDGEKMSKSKRNYPDPHIILDKYGSDALRLYLISTPIVRGDSMKFNEKGIKEIVRTTHIFINNSILFLKQMIPYYEKNYQKEWVPYKMEEILTMKLNIFDKMMLSYMQHFIDAIHQEMDQYKLYNIVKRIQEYIDKLSRWYLNYNKSRIKSLENEEDSRMSLTILRKSLEILSLMIGPFAPFLAETIYQELGFEESVHLQQMPRKIWNLDQRMVDSIGVMERIIDLSRKIRTGLKIKSFKMPIAFVKVILEDEGLIPIMEEMRDHLEEECNIKELSVEGNYNLYVNKVVKLNTSSVGPKYKKKGREINCIIEKSKREWVDNFIKAMEEKGEAYVGEYKLEREDVYIISDLKSHRKNEDELILQEENVIMYGEHKVTEEIEIIYQQKKFIHFVQELRKEVGLVPTDDISLHCSGDSDKFNEFMERNMDRLKSKLRCEIYLREVLESTDEEYDFKNEKVNISMVKS